MPSARLALAPWLGACLACSGAASDRTTPRSPPPVSAGASSEAKPVDASPSSPRETGASDAPAPSPSTPLDTAPPSLACQPQVTEVLLLPDDDGVSVTILGEGFCRGAGPASARFGELPLRNVIVASSGRSMAGHLDRWPPAGAVLEVHTPPGDPVVTRYSVPETKDTVGSK